MPKIASIASTSSLETHLHELEQIISDMMSYDVNNIEAVLAKFEKGVGLIRILQAILNKTQQEIDALRHMSLSQRNLSIEKDKAPNITSFEQNIETIKQLIAQAEKGDDIESTLAEFKRGIYLIWNAQVMLEKAEQRVRILTKNNDNIELEEFSLNNTDL